MTGILSKTIRNGEYFHGRIFRHTHTVITKNKPYPFAQELYTILPAKQVVTGCWDFFHLSAKAVVKQAIHISTNAKHPFVPSHCNIQIRY